MLMNQYQPARPAPFVSHWMFMLNAGCFPPRETGVFCAAGHVRRKALYVAQFPPGRFNVNTHERRQIRSLLHGVQLGDFDPDFIRFLHQVLPSECS